MKKLSSAQVAPGVLGDRREPLGIRQREARTAAMLLIAAGLTSCTSILGGFDFAKGTGGASSTTSSSGVGGSTASGGPKSCSAPSDCASGFCVDSVCCDSKCDGTCQACTHERTGSADGTCASVSAGLAAPAGQCAADPPCGNDGKCAAGGVCEQPAQGVDCGSTCTSASQTNSQCNGSGSCTAAASTPCPSSLQCNTAGTACLTSCAHDSDCTAGHFCSGGACMLEAGLGMPCTSGDECPSTFCVDNVCCNTACDTSMCSSCALPGSLGICSTEPDNQNNADHSCGTGSTCCGGTCTSLSELTSCGTCGTSCTSNTKCQTATCSGTACGTTPAPSGTTCNDSGGKVCNAAGSCVACNSATDCTGLTEPACCPGSVCIDLSSDMNNCGACGHGCLGGACTAGVCQPVQLASFVGNGSEGIALDATSVYWSYVNTGSGLGGAINKVGLGGGGPSTTLYTFPSGTTPPGLPWGVALFSGNIYFTNRASPGGVYGCTVAGCGTSPAELASSETDPTGIVVDTSYAYWTSTGVGIRYVQRGGGNPTTLVPTTASLTDVAIDANNLYWSTYTSTGTINATPRLGMSGSGTVNTLASNLYFPGNVVSDGSFVYFASGDGTVSIEKVAVGGATPIPLANAGKTTVNRLAFDSANVYWTTSSAVQACALPSCAGGIVTIAGGRNYPGPIAVDASAVYWVEEGLVMKVSK